VRTAATHRPSSRSYRGQPVLGREAVLGLLAALAALAVVVMLATCSTAAVTLGPWGVS